MMIKGLIKGLSVSAVVGFLAACHVSSTDQHTIVSNVPERVPAGACAVVEGPSALPAGATTDYTIVDSGNTDDMDVTIVDDGFPGCDFVDGDGTHLDVSSLSSSTGSLPSGAYDVLVRCNNAVQDCLFSLTWTANY